MKQFTSHDNRIKIYNKDCMEGMAQYPDDYFDIGIIDPPYGINFSGYERYNYKGKKHLKGRYKSDKDWDKGVPSDDYFQELKRITKNQIIWGGNYFPYLWKHGCKGFIFWYKGNPVSNFSDGELAYTSFDKVAKQVDYRYYGSLEGNTSAVLKIHPTQKPVKLYEWLYKNYTEKGCKVIDTHLGSGSNAIAAHYFGVSEFVGYELDEDYFLASIKRFKEQTSQVKLF